MGQTAFHHPDDRVHVITAGPFGQAVGLALSQLTGAVVTASEKQTDPSRWPIARTRVLVSWRPVPAIASALDNLSHAWRHEFVPCVLESQKLQIGPVVVPGRSACYECFQRRTLQHAGRAEARTTLLQEYDAKPDRGPKGYLDVFADLAAVRLAQTLAQLSESPESVAGRIWQMDLLTRQAVCSNTVGVHGCPKCGCGRDARTRSYQAMKSELEWLFPSKKSSNSDRASDRPLEELALYNMAAQVQADERNGER